MPLRFVVAVCALGAALSAQAAPDADPYTAGDPARMRRVGYVTFTPKKLRPEVEKALPQTEIRFVETTHFILGCALRATQAPRASAQRRKFAAEIKALRIVLPKIKKKPRTIDPWLHLHLYAARLERTYDEMRFLLRVKDSDFPRDARTAPRKPDDFMGYGPYLGMRGKYRVLILQTQDDIARLQTAIKKKNSGASAGPFQHLDPWSDSLLYAACLETYAEQRDPHLALRTQVRFYVVNNLLKGYRHYDFDVPAWVSNGVGNLLVRDWNESQFAFNAIRGGGEPSTRNAKWRVNTRNLVKNDLAMASGQLCVMAHANSFSLNDHMCSWSRIEFIRSLDEGKTLARFLRRMKQPRKSTGGPVPFEKVLECQADAFEKVLGMSFGAFDAAWHKHVLKHYKRR